MINRVHTSVRHIIISSEQVGQRLDNFLLRLLKGLPKSRIYSLIRKGEVRVNKKRAAPSYRLLIGDAVRVPPLRLPEPVSLPTINSTLREKLLQNILYEDKYLLALNKPVNLPVHSGTHAYLGVIEAMRQICPELKLELIHRLDKGTSGCLLLAKKAQVLRAMHQQLQMGKVDKHYLAVVTGRWPAHLTQCEAPLLKMHSANRAYWVKVSAIGKAACTQFTVQQHFTQATLLAITLLTGRTHQIRVHTAHLGYPIIGDDKYGNFAINREFARLGYQRLYLHAFQLNFEHPITREQLTITAPLPEDFQNLLTFLQNKN